MGSVIRIGPDHPIGIRPRSFFAVWHFTLQFECFFSFFFAVSVGRPTGKPRIGIFRILDIFKIHFGTLWVHPELSRRIRLCRPRTGCLLLSGARPEGPGSEWSGPLIFFNILWVILNPSRVIIRDQVVPPDIGICCLAAWSDTTLVCKGENTEETVHISIQMTQTDCMYIAIIYSKQFVCISKWTREIVCT